MNYIHRVEYWGGLKYNELERKTGLKNNMEYLLANSVSELVKRSDLLGLTDKDKIIIGTSVSLGLLTVILAIVTYLRFSRLHRWSFSILDCLLYPLLCPFICCFEVCNFCQSLCQFEVCKPRQSYKHRQRIRRTKSKVDQHTYLEGRGRTSPDFNFRLDELLNELENDLEGGNLNYDVYDRDRITNQISASLDYDDYSFSISRNVSRPSLTYQRTHLRKYSRPILMPSASRLHHYNENPMPMSFAPDLSPISPTVKIPQSDTSPPNEFFYPPETLQTPPPLSLYSEQQLSSTLDISLSNNNNSNSEIAVASTSASAINMMNLGKTQNSSRTNSTISNNPRERTITVNINKDKKDSWIAWGMLAATFLSAISAIVVPVVLKYT